MAHDTVRGLNPKAYRAQKSEAWFRPWDVGGTLWLMALSPGAAAAEPISYSGFSLAHSQEELLARLEGESYDCDPSYGIVVCVGPEQQLITAVYLTGDARSEAMLAVTCQALASCSIPTADMTTLLAAALLPDGRMEPALPPGGGPLSHCGVGSDGDSVCLGPDGTVTFFGAAYGPPRSP